MTKYIVLLHTGPAEWALARTIDASSAEAAIRKTATEPGTYVAVPERSFQQQTVEIKHRDPVMTITPLVTVTPA